MNSLKICFAFILALTSCSTNESTSSSAFVLLCDNISNISEITTGVQVDNEIISIPYENGSGQSYNSQIISSTGTTGLTARLSSGVLAIGSGMLDLSIDGLPNNQGVASFELIIDGVNCSLNIPVNRELSIGDNFQGGIVFYLDGTGRGLIASDFNIIREWGCSGANLNGSDSSVPPELDGLFSGYENTEYIANNCTFSSSFAAKVCYELVRNGYDDWYLPSKDELNLMCQNIYGSGPANIGNFSDGFYWSSTEFNAGQAWSQFFFTGDQQVSAKSQACRVRAIRSF